MTVKIDVVERDVDGEVNRIVVVVGHIEIAFVATKEKQGKKGFREAYRMNHFGGKSLYISPADWKRLKKQVYAIFYESKPKKEALIK